MPEIITKLQYDEDGRPLPVDALTKELYFAYRDLEKPMDRLLDIQQRYHLPIGDVANNVMGMLGLFVEET